MTKLFIRSNYFELHKTYKIIINPEAKILEMSMYKTKLDQIFQYFLIARCFSERFFLWRVIRMVIQVLTPLIESGARTRRNAFSVTRLKLSRQRAKVRAGRHRQTKSAGRTRLGKLPNRLEHASTAAITINYIHRSINQPLSLSPPLSLRKPLISFYRALTRFRQRTPNDRGSTELIFIPKTNTTLSETYGRYHAKENNNSYKYI